MKYWGGGRVPGASLDLYARPMVGEPKACFHRKILKSTILETPLSSILGTVFYRIPKVVKYVEDMIFS